MMKRKFTFLMFGLLLAVGWTNASAQALPEGGYAERLGLTNLRTFKCVNSDVAQKVMSLADVTFMHAGESTSMKAPRRMADSGPNSVVKDKAYYQQFPYSYTGDDGVHHSNVDPTEEAKDPHQIYQLLRWVYGNPNFPGPTYSAYTPDYVQEDPVVYGPIAGGWNITAASSGTTQVPNNTINITLDANAWITSIAVTSGETSLASWAASTAGNYDSGYTYSDDGATVYASTMPSDWTCSDILIILYDGTNYYNACYMNQGGTISIPIPGNYTDVQVTINALGGSTTTESSITVNEDAQTLSSESIQDYTWNLTFDEPSVPSFVQGTVQAPFEDGYTALVVSLYNDTTKIYPEDLDVYEGSWQFTDSTSLINYIRDNIQSVKLLTDGLRIGSRDDHTIGTVFSCDGTYNRFFLLGKGQARKKAPQLQTNINNGYWPSYCGEEGPFKTMFEQFSPTSGALGSDITDFYSKLMEGNVYNVVHDCASVIQNKHQFSMSGKKGTQAIALSGLNFFIPDYRLLWWPDTYRYSTYRTYTVDGRDFGPYIATNESTGQHTGTQFYTGTNVYYFAAWFAQYNKDFAPKMGIYKITLEATAQQVAQVYEPGNQNYEVTLTWVSSLNQMSGHDVAQIYTVYYWDPETGEQKYVVAEGITDGKTGLTTIKYLVEQKEHSYTIDYIVEGSPDDNDHPQFVAVSNRDGVVIPGWDDFVGLELDHHESDFVVADMANWYRNFLAVVNEDPYAGLTVSKVTGADGGTPMNFFNLYRYKYNGDVRDPEPKKIATLELSNATPTTVHYKVTYDDDASDAELEDQNVLAAKYQRQAMGIKDEGEIRVRGNGDLVIWPNGYFVNFKSITVKNNGTAIAGNSWNSSQNNLPSTWILSPGSKWEEHTTNTGDVVAYLEGGGYIAIPNMMNNSSYNNLTVEIVAYTDGANVGRIAVNDDSKSLTNNSATYTWTNLSTNALHAPKRASTKDVTFTAGTDASTGTSISKDGVTITNTHTTGNNGFNYNPYRLYSGPISITTTSGTITNVVFNGSDANSRPVTGISGNGYSTSNNVGTWTGDAQTVSLTASAQVRCTSIVVTVKTEDGGQTEVPITEWNAGSDLTAGWIMTPGDATGASGLGNGTNSDGSIWINPNGYITIPASFFENYTDIRVEVSYASDNGNSHYVTVDGSQSTSTTSSSPVTYTWNNVNASDGIKIETSGGYASIYSIKVYGTPTGAPAPVEGGLLRMHVLMVDQFKEDIPANNSHPDAYEYVLRYEPNGAAGAGVKESGSAKVDIEKTDAKANGYYTKTEIDDDTDAALTMNVLDAQVKMNLNADNPEILYFEMKGAPKNTIPDTYLTKLQYMRNIHKYEEMLEGSPNIGDQYDTDETHYYFNDATPEVGKYVGASGEPDWKAYAPMVSTWGLSRWYFEYDGENNTYGAPIWKTSVGDVQIQGKPALEKQVINAGTPQEAPNPYTSWTTEDGKNYSLFFIGVNAQGTLPSPEVTNVDYEPYMFRVFVASPSGKLRKYNKVLGEGGGYYLEDGGAIAANEKYCVGSFLVNDGWHANDLFFSKGIPGHNALSFKSGGESIDPDAWDGIMKFAAEDGIKADDIKVYVRFYYMTEGGVTRDGEARPGNGAEGSGDPDDPETFIYEYVGNAEVVGVTYFNAQGMKSNKPFDGVNIVVTKYSDGTTTTTKVLR